MEALQLQRKNKRALARAERLLLPHMAIQFDAPSSPQRDTVEQYIAQCFQASYQAEVNSFLPYLLSTPTEGKFTAALGFQPADTNNTLFLEQYLDSDIESVLSSVLKQTIPRNKIVEIGNLTSSRRGSSQLLFVIVAAILEQAAYEWVTFTATQQVKQLLEKLALNITDIAEANPNRLADKGESWGSYYNTIPKIRTTNLVDAMVIFRQHHVIKFMLKNYQNTINTIAKELQQ